MCSLERVAIPKTEAWTRGEGNTRAHGGCSRNQDADRLHCECDEQVITFTLKLILEQRGYRASAFHNAESVLKACEVDVPDLLISDVAMPGMNGIDLAIAMQDRFPSCRLLLFSGHAHTSALLREAALKGYRFDVQPKPLYPEELMKRVRDLLRAEL